MPEETPNPQINISKIAVGGGIAGAVVAIACMLIFLIGVPVVRYMFPPAVALGIIVALFLRFGHREAPPDSRILPLAEKRPDLPEGGRDRSSGRQLRVTPSAA